MKVSAGLFRLLLASQVLPWAIGPVHAQTDNSQKFEDESDGRKMQMEYGQAFRYASLKLAYSMEQVTEKNQNLADGNQIKKRESSMRYRDQNGRVRMSYKTLYGNERIFIADPWAKVAYLIRPDRKDVLRIKGEPLAYRIPADYLASPIRAPEWNKRVTTSLGLKEIAGVKAVGALTETFFPAGSRGNDKELVETSETWASNELPIGSIYSRNVSMRGEELTTHIENLKFGDVQDSLFTVPSDYPVRTIVLNGAPAEQ
ncbi:hypothetical protein [Massilia horti]|uniref:Outer membrane lipoprotein-sorting protein n=1 Tax=Massilia horti TaxID=2562153 RepID=A0A4Y9T5S2_9BURK|nr:hypothetical protein [Massilia horti]TFW35659.1 hypothetical protein E4O92_01495 [Massilia horti]